MKLDWLKLRMGAVLPLVALLLLAIASGALRDAFMFCKSGLCSESIPENLAKVVKVDARSDGPLPSDPREAAKEISAREIKDRQSTASKYSGRLTWSFLAIANLVIYTVSVVVVVVILYQIFPFRRGTYIVLLIFGLSILVAYVMYTHPAAHMALFLPLFRDTIVKDVPRIGDITNLMNSIGNGVAFALILTSCAILLPSYNQSAPEGLKDLSQRMKCLRVVLYVGTFLLIAAILLKKSLYQWSLAFTSREEQITKAAQDFLMTVLSIEGGFYTLMLAALYLPAAYVLERRARGLINLPEAALKREKKLKTYGMVFSFTESLPRILAILGPLLAGPVGELLKGVSK